MGIPLAVGYSRHPKKGKQWIKNRYFHKVKGVDWIFAVKTFDRKGKDKLLTLYSMASTLIERHVKVKGNASPDDPSLREYWAKRAEKQRLSYWEKNSRNYRIAANQNWKCPLCGEPLFNGEAIETHHVIPVKDGGTDEVSNLKHLHKACHQQVHGRKPSAKALVATSFERNLSRVIRNSHARFLGEGDTETYASLPDRGARNNIRPRLYQNWAGSWRQKNKSGL